MRAWRRGWRAGKRAGRGADQLSGSVGGSPLLRGRTRRVWTPGARGRGRRLPSCTVLGWRDPRWARCVCVGELLQALRGGHRMGQRAQDW